MGAGKSREAGLDDPADGAGKAPKQDKKDKKKDKKDKKDKNKGGAGADASPASADFGPELSVDPVVPAAAAAAASAAAAPAAAEADAATAPEAPALVASASVVVPGAGVGAGGVAPQSQLSAALLNSIPTKEQKAAAAATGTNTSPVAATAATAASEPSAVVFSAAGVDVPEGTQHDAYAHWAQMAPPEPAKAKDIAPPGADAAAAAAPAPADTAAKKKLAPGAGAGAGRVGTLRLQKTMSDTLRRTPCAGDLRALVKLPLHADKNEWLALNTIHFYRACRMIHDSYQHHCRPDTCPCMSAGAVEYLWKDNKHYPQATRVPACVYVELSLADALQTIDDERVFPVSEDQDFPRNFEARAKELFKRMFRQFAHLYYAHYDSVKADGSHKHLNSSFKHFILFVLEFDLVDSVSLAPLQKFITHIAG